MSWSLDKAPATGVLTPVLEVARGWGSQGGKLAWPVVTLDQGWEARESGSCRAVTQGQCLSPEGTLPGQGVVSLKSQLFPAPSLGTSVVYLHLTSLY